MLCTYIKKELNSFFHAISKTNELSYYILLICYIAVYFDLKIAWNEALVSIENIVRYFLLGIVMWGSTAYLFFVITEWERLWENTVYLLLVGVILLTATFLFSQRMTTNSYGVVMDIFFCVMACGKSFRKILNCIFGVIGGGLIFVGIGSFIGFALDVQKPYNVSPGHSLGINYPNTWGYLFFLALMIAWYLFLRKKPLSTFAIFWIAAAINYFYISCRTIAGITLIFPFVALAVDALERKERSTSPSEKKRFGILGWSLILLPFIVFFIMFFLSLHVEWMYGHFAHTPLHNLAMRFWQGGMYFRTYGFPLFGNPYRSDVITYMNVNGELLQVGILDSSFAAYLIMRGVIWITGVLCWLCFAHWKAIKRKDYGIVFLSVVILLFAMMERPGLEMWYNFVLLYPLAKLTNSG